MSNKSKKQFGVWMDGHHATVIGKQDPEDQDFVVLGHIKNQGAASNSNENTEHNHEIALTRKFFKEIANLMLNAEYIHATGTGQAQEQFIKFLAETPQYKNAQTSESTSNKMSDEALISFMDKHFN